MTLLELANEMSEDSLGTSLKKLEDFMDTEQYLEAYTLTLCLLFSMDNFFTQMVTKKEGNSEFYDLTIKYLRKQKLFYEECFHNNN